MKHQYATERMAQELLLAGRVQASFLPPEVPEIPGWLLSATLKPASEASGDFYDFISLPNARWGFVVLDVTDKGVAAAVYMALCCTLIRTFAQQHPAQPELVLSAVNRRILKDCSANQFVTVFYGVLDPVTGMLVYANAGHCPALHFPAKDGAEVHELARTGMPLGILKDRTWGQERVKLDPGDLLVLYTDGITEAHGEPPSLFGEQRLLTSVRAALGTAGTQRPSAQELQDHILADVDRFVGGAPRSDDIALTILMRR